MAARDNRTYILNRRGTGIADLTARTPLNGELTVEQAEKLGFYNINCSHQIGIATSTEVGLAPERVPIRVVIGGNDRAGSDCDTVAHYWTVTDASGKHVPFSRKALASDKSITALYKYVPDLDDMLWAYGESVKYKYSACKMSDDAEFMGAVTALFALTQTPVPSLEQQAEIITRVTAIIAAAEGLGILPMFQLTDTQFMWGVPHGIGYATRKRGKLILSPNRIANHEAALCIKVNYAELKRRKGVITSTQLELVIPKFATKVATWLLEITVLTS